MNDAHTPADPPSGLISQIIGPFASIARTLNDRVYGPYALGNFLSVNGIWVQRLGVGWLTWELTESPGWLGAVAFANLFPLAVFAPLAGAAADRWNTLNLLRISNWLIAAQSLAMLFLFVTDLISIVWILILTTALGVVMALNQPSRLAIEPTLVSRDKLPTAIAISSLSFNGGQFIGPALFAMLIPILGIASTFVFQAATYTLFGIILIWTRPRADTPARKKPKGGLFSDIGEGFSYCWNHVGLMPLIVLLTAVALGTRAFVDLFAGFADHVFNRGAEGLGLLTASIGIGAMIGILFLARRTNTRGLVKTILLFAPGTCVATLLFIATDIFWMGMIGALCMGFCSLPVAVGTQTLMQSSVDPALRGRVMAVYVTIWRSMPAVGALAMGYAAEFVGLRWPPVVGVVLVLAVVAWVWMHRKAIADACESGPE